MIIELTSADLSADPRLDDYTRLKDVKLRSKLEPERGLYMAESTNVIERALSAGHNPRSFLMSSRWLPTLSPLIETATGADDGLPPAPRRAGRHAAPGPARPERASRDGERR